MSRLGVHRVACVVCGVLWWVACGGVLADAGESLIGDLQIQREVLGNGLEIIVVDQPGGLFGDKEPVQVWIRFESGSMHERQDQRGAAMIAKRAVLYGTPSLSRGEILVLFDIDEQQAAEGQGGFVVGDHMAFVLQVEPDAGIDGIVKVFGLAQDLISGFELSDEAIEGARAGVFDTIESVERDDVLRWLRGQWMPEMMGSGGMGQLPLPSQQACGGIEPDAVRRYTQSQWVPGNAIVLVVGDVGGVGGVGGVDEVIAEARRMLGGKGKGEGRGNAEGGLKIPTISGIVVGMNDDRLEESVLGLVWIGPLGEIDWDRSGMGGGGYEEILTMALAGEAMRFRVNRMLRRAFDSVQDAKVQVGAQVGGVYGGGDGMGGMRFGQMIVEVEGQLWEPVLGAMEIERQRLVRDGLSHEEIERGREWLIQQWGYEMDQWENATTAERARIVNWILTAGRPLDDFDLWMERGPEILERIEDAQVNAMVKSLIGEEDPAVLVLVDSAQEVDQAQIRRVIGQARRGPIETLDPKWIESMTGPILNRVPDGGRVDQISVHRASGVVSATLDNGIGVHYRQMVDPQNPDMVRVHVRVGFDSIETAAMNGVGDVFAEAIDRGLIQSRTHNELRGILVEHGIELNVYLGTLEVEIRLAMPVESLERSMELAFALLTDLRIEQGLIDLMAQEAADGDRDLGAPVGAMEVGIVRAFGVGFENRLPTKFGVDVDARSARAWIRTKVVGRSIDIGIAGGGAGLDATAAIEMCASYLGALESGYGAVETGGDLGKDDSGVIVRGEEMVTVYDRSGKQGVAVGFGACSTDDIESLRALIVAAMVLDDRLGALVEHGQRDSISASAMTIDFVLGRVVVSARVDCEPAEIEAWAIKLEDQIERLALEGIEEHELDGPKSRIERMLENRFEETEFWAQRLARLDGVDGTHVDLLWSIREGYQELDRVEVWEVFEKWYQDGEHFRVRFVNQDDDR